MIAEFARRLYMDAACPDVVPWIEPKFLSPHASSLHLFLSPTSPLSYVLCPVPLRSPSRPRAAVPFGLALIRRQRLSTDTQARTAIVVRRAALSVIVLSTASSIAASSKSLKFLPAVPCAVALSLSESLLVAAQAGIWFLNRASPFTLVICTMLGNTGSGEHRCLRVWHRSCALSDAAN